MQKFYLKQHFFKLFAFVMLKYVKVVLTPDHEKICIRFRRSAYVTLHRLFSERHNRWNAFRVDLIQNVIFNWKFFLYTSLL